MEKRAMSHFTPEEIEYLTSQRLGRLATANTRGELHVVPVGFLYNPALDTIDIGGVRPGFGASRKFRDARRTGQVAFVVDDAYVRDGQDAPSGPRREIRGIEIRGRAEAHETGGEALRSGAEPQFIRICPTHIVSWGINNAGYHPDSRRVG
jgi:pyridoxamine 5'-phosphate oxidase family protein